ncbi:MAG TPA: hypothetical protein VKA43_06885 [Gammaproteobacteria bacterium]|nr:hypothetical protein [Gammaproteobacteria bacterium]
MTRTTYPRLALVIGAVLLAAVAGTHAQAQGEAQPAPAQSEPEIDRTPEDCVVASRIARNVAVNDRQVVFFMRGDTYYRNDLDAACQSLTAGETRLVLHFRNTGSAKMARVCGTDAFTVERQTSRIGCGLGSFHPITADEAAALTGQPVAAPRASSSGSSESSGRSSRRERRN